MRDGVSYCLACGGELAPRAAFCQHCGAAVTAKPTPAPGPTPMLAPDATPPVNAPIRPVKGVSGGLVFALIVGALAVVAVIFLISTANHGESNCVIGLTGHSASLEIRGVGADEACQRFVASNPSWFLRSTAPVGATVCETDQSGFHFIGRNESGADLAGGQAMCRIALGWTSRLGWTSQ